MVMVCGFAGLLHASRKEAGKTELHGFHDARTLDEVHGFLVLGAGELQSTILRLQHLIAVNFRQRGLRQRNADPVCMFQFHFALSG